MRARVLPISAAALALAAARCKPTLDSDDSLVTSPRIVAVRAEPPEAKPGTPADYTALVASPLAAAGETAIRWRWCVAPEPLADDNAVSPACLDEDMLVPAGAGASVRAPTPADGCALFGPDTPPGGFRPHDPDATGGFYQPLRADLVGAAPVFALVRITCDPAGLAADLASQFAKAYVPNENPHVQPLVTTVGGAPASLRALSPGARVTMQVSWLAGDAETYAYFDAATQTVVTKRESMRVAWLASGGAFDVEATGRGEDDPATATENTWTAPLVGSVHLWIVLRDSRGGVDFADYEADIAN